jgi:hypothetical protein
VDCVEDRVDRRERLLALRDRLWQAINDPRGSNRGDLDGLPRETSALVIRYQGRLALDRCAVNSECWYLTRQPFRRSREHRAMVDTSQG